MKTPKVKLTLKVRKDLKVMKYTKEELDKLIEQAPKNDKGKAILPEEDFLDNLKELPQGTRSDTGKVANNGGFLDPCKSGDARSRELQSKGGTNAQKANAERRKIAESIDLFLKRVDENGVSMQDRIVEAMGLKAMDGCVGAAEFLRDTVGEKPSDNLNLEVVTDADREIMKNLTERLGLNDKS